MKKLAKSSKSVTFDLNKSLVGTDALTGYNNQAAEISERKKREMEYTQKDLEYIDLFENAPIGYHEIDLEGRIVRMNQTELNMLGYTFEELKGQFVWELSADKAFSIKVIKEKLKNHQISSTPFERDFVRKDGTKISILIMDKIIYSDNADVIGLRSSIQDNTQRKQAERALVEKEAQYHALADNGMALIWTSDTNKLCTYFNKPWLKFTGRKLEQELGNGWAEGVHPADFDRCLETYLTAFDKREAFSMEYRLKHVSGEYRWLIDMGTPNYNSLGEFTGYIGQCFDIQDIKNSENEVLRVNKHFQAIIEKSPDGFVLLNSNGMFQYASPSALKMFGYELDELISMHPNELTHPDDLAMVLGHLTKMFEDSTYVPIIEYRFKRKNGDWLWIESTFSNLLADQNMEVILINFRNINDRKIAEEKILKNKELLNILLKNNSVLIEDSGIDIDYENLCEEMREITGAKYASFNLFEPNGLDFRTVALSGMNDIYSRAAQFIGYNMKDKVWKFDPIRDERIKANIITRFENLPDLIGKVLPKTITKIIEKTLNLGEIDIVNLSKRNKRIGDFCLYFEAETILQNPEIVELFANQAALYVDRKLANQQQKEISERLRRAELASKLGNWELHLDKQTLFASEGALRVYGLSKSQFSLKEIQEIAMQEYRPMMAEALKNLIENNEIYDVEYKMKTNDTHEIKDIHSTALLNRDKKIVFGVIQDITERKQAEEKLQNNHDILSKLLFASSEFIDNDSEIIDYKKISDIILDVSCAKYCSFNILNQNHSGFRTVSISGIDTIQKTIKSIIGFDLLKKEWEFDSNKDKKINHKVITKFDSLAELTGTVLPKEIVRVTSKMFDIGEVWIVQIKKKNIVIGDFTLLYSRKETLQNPEIVELFANQIALYVDRKLADQQQKESSERLRRAELASKSGNWEFHFDTNTMHLSEGANKICGLNDSSYNYEVVKQGPQPEYRAIIDKALKNLIEKNEPYNIEFKIKTADTGEIKDIYSTAVYDKDKKIVFGIIQDITDRKKAEEKLLENNQRSQAMLDAIPDMMFRVNSDGVYLDYMADDKELYTQSDLSIIGKRNRDITPPEFANLVDSMIRTALETGTLQTFEYQLPIPEMGMQNYEARMITSGTNEVTAIVRNNTKSKQAEIALRESENKYRLLFETNPIPMSIFDTETLEFLSVNNAFVDKYGYDENEFSKMTILDIRPKEEFEKLKQSVQSADNGIRNAGVFIHKKKNNELILVEIIRHDILFNGKNAKMVLANDITERIRAENALQKSEIFFRQSQQAAKIGSYNLDIASGLWSSSEVLDDIFGIDKQYVRNIQNWSELVAVEDREMMNDYFANQVLGQKQRFNKEYRISRISDGKIHWVLGLGELTIENNVITAMVGTIQDITERKNIEQELNEKMTEMTRFYNLTVGRELAMIDLKKEINELLVVSGEKPKYKIVE
ncbi:MAG: PAS domain S-box protein [Paludibacter sp.]